MNTSVIIVMGVSGAGKTTIGKLLAAELGWQFKDADDFHTAANKAKMHQGIALTDADRLPWLQGMAQSIENWLTTGEKTVLACSALKNSYRALLAGGNPEVVIVYLRADYGAIAARLINRKDHFMNKDLLQSQFAALEEPQMHESASLSELEKADNVVGTIIAVDATQAPENIVSTVRHNLKL